MKKLVKGQKINLQKNSIKFKNTQYLAIYIESNQNDKEKTLINYIGFTGKGGNNYKAENNKDNEVGLIQSVYDDATRNNSLNNDISVNDIYNICLNNTKHFIFNLVNRHQVV